MASKPPITCHVLDTTTGQPASSLAVTLTLVSPAADQGPAPQYTADTDADGRVLAWHSGGNGGPSVEAIFAHVATIAAGEALVWSLKFDAGSYFKGEGFWTDVEIRFKADPSDGRGHWHVPLLLGPWTYTTYRGS